jgi:hypothetical protein
LKEYGVFESEEELQHRFVGPFVRFKMIGVACCLVLAISAFANSRVKFINNNAS